MDHLPDCPGHPRPPRGPRSLLNGAGLTLALCWLALVGLTLRPDDDFAQFRRGAVDLREHDNPYHTRSDPAAEARRRPGTVDETNERGFKYPPVFAYLLQPFARLSHRAGQWTWFGLNLAFLAALLGLCVRLTGSALARRYWGVLVFAAVLAPPTRLTLQLGQMSLLMALLLVGAYALARRHARLAGLLLAVAGMIKLYPALLAAAFLLYGPRRVALWAAAWAALLVAAFLPVYGTAHYRAFLDALILSSNHAYGAEFNLSFVGFWSRLLSRTPYAVPLVDAPLLARTLVVLSGLAALAVCVAATGRPRSSGMAPLEYSLWLCAMLLLSPINGCYNLVLLLLPLLAVLRRLEEAPDRRVRNWLAGGTLLACLPPAWSDNLPSVYTAVHTTWGVLVLAPAFYGLLIYFGLIAYLLRRPAAVTGGTTATDGKFPLILPSRATDTT
jgi:hypothetical protein